VAVNVPDRPVGFGGVIVAGVGEGPDLASVVLGAHVGAIEPVAAALEQPATAIASPSPEKQRAHPLDAARLSARLRLLRRRPAIAAFV
jgi:hypothetical protein